MRSVTGLLAVLVLLGGLVHVVTAQSGTSVTARQSRETTRGNDAVDVAGAVGNGLQATSLEIVGQVGGASQAVDVVDGFAYVAIGPRLHIVDVSQPEAPQLVAKTEILHDIIEDVRVAGGHAYVAARSEGLHVIDVSDPAAPRTVGVADGFGRAHGVDVHGAAAYVIAWPQAVHVVDVRDPASPVVVSSFEPGGRTVDLSVADGRAYIANGANGLRIYDLSDPLSPSAVGLFDSIPSADAVAVDGSLAYVTQDWRVNKLSIVDIADPASPALLGELVTEAVSDVAAMGSYAYLVGAASMEIIDASDPSAPRRSSSMPAIGWPLAIAVHDSHAFVAARSTGLHVINVSVPSSPADVAVLPSFGAATSVEVDRAHAYVTTFRRGIRVIDVSEPADPHEVVALEGGSPENVRAVGG